jgi:mycothiol system anti-sigma-R factor
MSDTHSTDNLPSPIPDARDVKKNSCDEYAVAALRYIDNDLEGEELENFRSHLDSCANCRAHVEREKALSQLLHQSRPLYSAPAALRARVNAAAAQIAASAPTRPLYQRIFQALSRTALRIPSLRVLVPATVVIAFCLAFVPNIVRNVRAASYVETAAATHHSYLDGSLPIGFHTNSPELVTTWFAGKVPFDFKLPAESVPESKPAYQLTGASVVKYKGSPAALVTYETQNEKISLLVVSSESAVVAGGDEVRFGTLTFHYYTNSGFRVITWSNHGLSYALVSSVSGPARASCLVCHQNMTDKGSFRARP